MAERALYGEHIYFGSLAFPELGACNLAGQVLDDEDDIYDYWYADLRCGEEQEAEYTMKLNAWRLD